MSFVGELKRRNVIRVAILYFVSSWLLLADISLNRSGAPVIEWIRAMENPGADHSVGLARWQEKGLPDFCRPVGVDDFECDDPR